MADSKVVKFFKKLGQKFGRKIDVSKDLENKINELDKIVDKEMGTELAKCNYLVLDEIKEKIKEIYNELEKDVKEQEATGNYKKFCDEFEKRTNELYNLKTPENLDYNSYIKAFEKILKLFILECKKYIVAESRFQKVANFTDKEIESMLDKKSENDAETLSRQNQSKKEEMYIMRKNDDYKKYADLGLSLIHKVSYNRVEHVVKPLLSIFTDAIINTKSFRIRLSEHKKNINNLKKRLAKEKIDLNEVINISNEIIPLLKIELDRIGHRLNCQKIVSSNIDTSLSKIIASCKNKFSKNKNIMDLTNCLETAKEKLSSMK